MSEQQINRCGDCYSCCKSYASVNPNEIEVVRLDVKYDWGRCNKLCDNNRCTIYENRPRTCSDFECLYVESDLPEQYLPERVGFVTQLRKTNDEFQLHIVPNESRKYNIDPKKFHDDNLDNILVMKQTAEETWSVIVRHISVQCHSGGIRYEC